MVWSTFLLRNDYHNKVKESASGSSISIDFFRQPFGCFFGHNRQYSGLILGSELRDQGGVQESICGAGDWTLVCHMKGKCSAYCIITYASLHLLITLSSFIPLMWQTSLDWCQIWNQHFLLNRKPYFPVVFHICQSMCKYAHTDVYVFSNLCISLWDWPSKFFVKFLLDFSIKIMLASNMNLKSKLVLYSCKKLCKADAIYSLDV